jgi:glutamyl-tRNA reductase
MLKGYHIVTLTHRTSTLDEIGRVVPDPAELSARLYAVKDFFGWEELFFLSTCNRIMIGFYTQETADLALLRSNLAVLMRPELNAQQAASAGAKFQILNGGDAVRHVFEVASAMDSLVVGEREIIRQLRESYERCRNWGLTGDHFRLLMTQAIEVSKLVFNDTGIGEKALSIVALGYGEMRKKGITPEHHVVLVGAGATNALLCKFLIKDGFQHVTIFNRTLQKAIDLAALFSQGEARPLSSLPQFAAHFDAMVVCTGAINPVLTPAIYQHFTGIHQEKMIVDFSVPNNVDLLIPSQYPVHFIEIEGLRDTAKDHLAYRECARQQAEHLISDRLEGFRYIWHDRQVERSLSPMIEAIKSVKEHAITTVFNERIAALDPAAQDLLFEMMGYMEKKCVSIPVKTMKSIAQKMARNNRVKSIESTVNQNHLS